MIELISVSKSFQKNRIIENCSFKFESESKTAIVGPSGTGKTTLLNLLSGLVGIDKGEIRIDGRVTDTSEGGIHPSQRNIGYCFQFPSLWPHMTVEKNIMYGVRSKENHERMEKYQWITKRLDIQDLSSKYPNELSGGQAKRVSLARTLIVKPRYLFLDEPMNNLDQDLKDRTLSIIMELVANEKITLIYVTHELRNIVSLFDNVCLLKDRKISLLKDMQHVRQP